MTGHSYCAPVSWPQKTRVQVQSAEMGKFEEVMREIAADLKAPVTESLSLLKVSMQDVADQFHEPIDDIVLTRFLLANDFDHSRAKDMLEKRIAWRKSISGLVHPVPEFFKSCFLAVPCCDRLGRPVVVVRTPLWDASMPSTVFQVGYRSIMDMLIFHTLQNRRHSTFSTTDPLEQFVLIVDGKGGQWSNFAMEHYKVMGREGDCNYPEFLGLNVVINSNYMARFSFACIKPFLHARTKRKVALVSPEDTPKYMSDLIDPKYLPADYGGTAPSWSEPAHASTLEDFVGDLAAHTWRKMGVTLNLGNETTRLAAAVSAEADFKVKPSSGNPSAGSTKISL
eukprot:TRINITY_DN95205_c0_g1_i1.p1 TRINITY_DN95205_c0_g1~~TRINITY_DN95205_c0_g1_i1.p1  ORF type:complete len:339 (-),score=35.18 TRINITY_DN95205_c0_g1_i1:133-1149(-)